MESNERGARQRAVVERMLNGVNQEKRQSLPGIHAADFAGYDRSMGAALESLEEFSKFGDAFIAAIDDYRLNLELFFSTGLSAVFTYTLTGTFRAARGGKQYPLSLHGMSLLEFTHDDLIRREYAYFDLPALLRQLELPPLALDGLVALIGLDDLKAPKS